MWTPNCGKNYSEVGIMSLAIQGCSILYGVGMLSMNDGIL